MAHEEEGAFPVHLNPLISVVTMKEFNLVLSLIVCIHELDTDSNRDNRKRSKQEICPEEHFGLLQEKFFIEPDSVDVALGHFVEVDEVVFLVQCQIEDLLRQNEDSKCTEHERVELYFTTVCPKDAKEQNHCENMKEDARNTICHKVAVLFLVIFSSRAPVCHNAEGHEVAVRAQEQVHVDSGHVVPDELIDDEVDELGALKANEPFYFGATLDGALVVYQPTNHKLGHDEGLHADPDLFSDESESVGVLLVVCVSETFIKVVGQVDRHFLNISAVLLKKNIYQL